MAQLDKFTIRLNPFEAGALMGLIMQAEDGVRQDLNGVWQQLVTHKKQTEQEAGVTKEALPGGLLRITDKAGNVIIRAPYPFEVEGN